MLRRCEAHYPQAIGGTDRDDTVRSSLVLFANDCLAELDREERWSLSYAEPYLTTVSGTRSYAIPYPQPAGQPAGNTSPVFVKRLYYINTAGTLVELERMEKRELQRVYGDGTVPPAGAPIRYAIEPSTDLGGSVSFGSPALQIYFYPTPDANGPQSGNYQIYVGGYWQLPQIIETVGNALSGNTTLTYSTAGSGSYLTAAGLPSNGSQWGQFVSVRAAGNPTGITAFPTDTHITSWTAIAANTATLQTSPGTTANNCQTFFNSFNWVIQHWPKLLQYGILKEVAAYYGKADQMQIWEGKFAQQMEKLRAYEGDRNRGMEQLAAAQSGQLAGTLRRIDGPNFLDVRGGTF